MSFILSFKNDFEKIAHIFETFFKQAPNWAMIAETDLAYIAPVLNTIVTLTAGANADAELQAIIATVQKDLVLATKFVQAVDSSANLTDVLTSISTNLSGLLTIGAIKNSGKVTEITAYVNGIIGEIEAILAALPKAA